MSEDNGLVGEVVKQSKDVLGKAYDDLAHPTAKSIGNTISFLPRTIGIWFSKWEKWIINGEESIRLTAEAVKEKAKEIPEDKLTEPEPYVAVPAIQQLSYCYDSKELREMYANLLVASMNTDTKYHVHPSFVDIIKQLTPDEAKLLTIISSGNSFPIIDVMVDIPDKKGYVTIVHHFSDLSYGICDYPAGVSSYLENFARLGIIEIDYSAHFINKELYVPLENHTEIKKVTSQTLPEKCSYRFERGSFQTTAFGKDFISTCVIQASKDAKEENNSAEE